MLAGVQGAKRTRNLCRWAGDRRLGNRGVTLLELLVAVAVSSIVILGIMSFYVAGARFNVESKSQAFIQRQATIVMNELATVIASAQSIVQATCGGSTGLQVLNSNLVNVPGHPGGTYCFHLNAANHIVEDSPNGTIDLLSGSPVTMTVPAGGFTVCVSTPPSDACLGAGVSGQVARVTFTLRDTLQDQISMTFGTSMGRLN